MSRCAFFRAADLNGGLIHQPVACVFCVRRDGICGSCIDSIRKGQGGGLGAAGDRAQAQSLCQPGSRQPSYATAFPALFPYPKDRIRVESAQPRMQWTLHRYPAKEGTSPGLPGRRCFARIDERGYAVFRFRRARVCG